MRKLAFIISFSFISLFSNAQTIDSDTRLITYSEVVEVPTTSKSELYVRASTWFSRTFKSAKAVIQLEDKEAGKLIGKGNIPVVIKVPIIGKTDAGAVAATITVICKDGKYKYIIDNLSHQRPYGPNTEKWVDGGPLEQEKPKVGFMNRPSKKEWTDIKEATDSDIKAMVADLKKSMSKSDSDF
jgi:ribosomal protein L15